MSAPKTPVPLTPERQARIAERLRNAGTIEPAAAPSQPEPATPGEIVARAITNSRRA